MKNSAIKFTALALTVALTSTTLVGCGKDENRDPYLDLKKNELVSMARTYESMIDEKDAKIVEQQEMLKGIGVDTNPMNVIDVIPDGTQRLTFNEFEGGYIKLPSPLSFISTSIPSANNRVMLNDAISVSPNKSWVVNMDGVTLELEHKELGIGVQIKIANAEYTPPEAFRTLMFDNFFTQIPPTEVKYSPIFIDDTERGVDTYFHQFIDDTQAKPEGEADGLMDGWIRIGILQYGDYSIVYTACYKGEESGVKNDIIVNLLKTLTINTNSIDIQVTK